MKLEIINNVRVITPAEKMWLCNKADKIASDKVYLGVNADETMWEEITADEKENLEKSWKDTEATEADYINALEDLGVNFNE